MSQQQFLDIVANPEVIAVNQDPRVAPGRNVTASLPPALTEGHAKANPVGQQRGEVWAKTLADGSVAVLLINSSPGSHGSNITVTATWQQVGLKAGSKAEVRDLWARHDLGVADAQVSASLSHHDCTMLKLTPSS